MKYPIKELAALARTGKEDCLVVTNFAEDCFHALMDAGSEILRLQDRIKILEKEKEFLRMRLDE